MRVPLQWSRTLGECGIVQNYETRLPFSQIIPTFRPRWLFESQLRPRTTCDSCMVQTYTGCRLRQGFSHRFCTRTGGVGVLSAFKSVFRITRHRSRSWKPASGSGTGAVFPRESRIQYRLQLNLRVYAIDMSDLDKSQCGVGLEMFGAVLFSMTKSTMVDATASPSCLTTPPLPVV